MGDLGSMLPLLMMDDETFDMKSIFLLSNMMSQDCGHDSATSLIPMLMMAEVNSTDNLMMIMMLMATEDNPMHSFHDMLEFLEIIETLKHGEQTDSLLTMVLLNSMTGGMKTEEGFANNFNLLLPLVMQECENNDVTCEKKQKNLMVMMMAMQSQAPNTNMGSNIMLPLLLMDDEKDNQNLMFYMMTSMNKPAQC
jgi:hypothetical protein